MEEQAEYSLEELENALAEVREEIKELSLVTELTESEAYKTIIEKRFVKAYRETSAMNVARFNAEQTQNYVHHIKARAIFLDYIEECKVVLESAIAGNLELEELVKEAKKAEAIKQG